MPSIIRNLPFYHPGLSKKGSSDFIMTGDLTIRGITRSVELNVGFGGISGRHSRHHQEIVPSLTTSMQEITPFACM